MVKRTSGLRLQGDCKNFVTNAYRKLIKFIGCCALKAIFKAFKPLKVNGILILMIS